MPKYYLLDENKNLVEVVNIENNLFRTRLEKLHSEINDTDHNIEFVTQAQYNQLQSQGQLVANTYYFITDDTTAEDLEDAIQRIIEGTTQVEYADHADYAGAADYAKTTDASNVWVERTFDDILEFQKCDVLLINYGGGGAQFTFVVTNNFRDTFDTVILFSSVCENASGTRYQFRLQGSNQNNKLRITSVKLFINGQEAQSHLSTFRIKAIH